MFEYNNYNYNNYNIVSLLNPGDPTQTGQFVENYKGFTLFIHTAGTFEVSASIGIKYTSGGLLDDTTWTYRSDAEAHINSYCASHTGDSACTGGGGGGGGNTGYSCANSCSSPNCAVGTNNCFSTQSQCSSACSATGTGYVCSNSCASPVTCVSGTPCYTTQSACSGACSTTGTGYCDQKQNVLFLNHCIPNNIVYGFAGLVVLMMLMKR